MTMISVTPRLADEDDGVTVGRETVAGEVDVVADALGRVAVVAHTVNLTRRGAAQTGSVDGSGHVAGALEG